MAIRVEGYRAMVFQCTNANSPIGYFVGDRLFMAGWYWVFKDSRGLSKAFRVVFCPQWNFIRPFRYEVPRNC